ncbi:MAG TPA: PBP1A family penicillin-binding protein [Vicinamibacteria bacterium]|nr:PBP1A family penicillin-binding protein [Vicinamibacteria bacterium]
MVVLLIAVAALAFAGVLWGRCGLGGCPNVDGLAAYQPGGAPVLLDRNGKPFADLAPVPGELVPIESLPRHVVEAFLAVEDRRFFEHRGVDWYRVGGAALANVRAGGYDEGFSTVSMQLARNVFPDRLRARDRTPWRKLMEIRVALEVEGKYGKDEILELYLNHIYFGNGARGVEAASRHYFGVGARRLSLAQAATLAALPKAPSHYDPRRHPRAAKERRNLVLALMEQQKRIEAPRAAEARQQPLRVVRRAAPGRAAPLAGWYVEEVRRELEERLGEQLYEDSLRIHTTLDVEAQRAAEEELARQLRAIEGGSRGRFSGPRYGAEAPPPEKGTPYLQGALVMLESRTGDVLAWVGGRDFRHSRFDRARAARRQAGSAFKPFVYAAALASGRTLSQRLVDEPLRVALDRRRSWEPKNFDGAFDGPVSLREALVRSKNVPTIRLAQSVGYDRVAETARSMGIDGPIDRRPSMPLGTVSVSPLELTAAYTVLSTLGEAAVPRFVRRVETPDEEVLWEAAVADPERVLEPGIAFLVTDALREALERGTGTAVRSAGFRGPAAGKTGTTNDGTDTWFVGYTPEVTAAVWIGFDRPRPITRLATGGRLAAPVWGRVMARYHAGRSLPPRWSPPSGVFQAAVDPATGFILAEGCQPQSGPSYREYFLRGMSPPSVCPSRGAPVEMMADLEWPLPDDEEATDLSLELPPELRALPPVLEEEEDEAAEETGEPAADEAGGAEAEGAPEVEPADTPSPVPTPSATPAATPTPSPTPTPTADPTPAPPPPPEPEP